MSKIILRNFCSSTIEISVESSLSTGLLYILQRLQKCAYCVLLLENFKPFLKVQLFILFRHCWSWCSIVLCVNLQQIRKSSTYSEPSTPKFKHFTMLFIFILNKVTDRMLPCGTPISYSCSSESVVLNCTWNFQLFQKYFLYSIPYFSSLWLCHVSMWCRRLFLYQEYGFHVFFFSKSICYDDFQADKVIICTSCFPKACLKVGD